MSEEENREYAAQIESSNAYLLDLVNNVVDIADMDSLTEDMPKRSFDVDTCCRSVFLKYFRPSKRGSNCNTFLLWHR